jgi:elongation factor P
MLAYNEIKPKNIIVYNGEPHQVLESDIAKRTKQKPVNQTKLKNLATGSIVQVAFRQSDKVEEADITKQEIEFAYHKPGKDIDEYWFIEPGNPKNRFQLEPRLLDNIMDFIAEGEVVEALLYEAQIIQIEAPIKVFRTVKSAPPNIKGNTSAGGNKVVVLDTGYQLTTPLFIETGDTIEVNTQTGEYVTRIKKA